LWRNGKKEMLAGNDGGARGETHSQERFTAEAIGFVREHQNEPFFLYLPFIIPHVSIQVPDAELAQYKEMPERKEQHRDGYKPHPTPRAGYAAMVSYMDEAIGEILAELDKLKLADNTIVLFTSDNGPTHGRVGGADSDFFASSGPLRGRKGSVYEGGLRVPLIVRWPGKVKAGSVNEHVAAFWDVLPTVCNLAGIESSQLPDGLDGLTFAPTLQGKPHPHQKVHGYLYWEFPGYGGQQAIRMGDWKAVRTEMHKAKRPLKTQLFLLSDDIGETKDVADEHPEVVAQMEKLMQDAREPSKQFPFKAIDP
jgi:arylsulfatase